MAKIPKMLENKYVLFDTNIFIKAFENFNAFSQILYLLKDCNCQIVHFPLVEFEFTRNAYLPEHRMARENFIKKIASFSMPLSPGLIESALRIARIYAHKNIPTNQISLVDCCIAAYLMQYSGKLYLLTLNHKDFPVILFDRVYAFALDDAESNDVFAPAFYIFNKDKWEKLNNDFQKLSLSKK